MMRIEIVRRRLRVGRAGLAGIPGTEIATRLAVRLASSALVALLALSALTASEVRAFSAADVYRSASGSVVLIFGFDEGGKGSSGTGSIISPDGLVLTNNHVIAHAETGRLFPNLVVYFKPKPISGDNRQDLRTPYLVDVIARDPDLDLALLRVKEAPSGLRPLEIGNSEEVDIGESVAAIGHPGGGGLWTLTTGTVSSKRKDQARDIFQTDTAINPGNSGGPLLDEYSRLVGVNTFVRRVNDQGLPLEGLNYSLRSSLALAWVNQQGVARVAAVSRASSAESRPAPPPTSAPQEEPAPRVVPEPVPEPEVERAQSPAPEPRVEVEPEPAPPRVQAPEPRVDPVPEPEAREFVGPEGETMYGVPNPDVDLDEALLYAREGYQKLIERADESVREMDRLFDDYDNF
jgi:S1-C subfamily serine protease